MAADRAYLDALKQLARRELTEAHIRQRLTRRGHAAADVEQAVTRLKAERAIDDTRVAGAMARTEITLKQRGPARVRQKLERAGIAPATARQAVDEAFGDVDADWLIETSLAKRLRPDAAVETDTAFARLGRYLAGQGFDGDQIVRVLSARRRRS